MGLFVIWILFGVGAAIIASNKGANGGVWFVLGLLFGPFALLFALFQGKECPHCKSKIHQDAKVCPKCQREVGAEAGNQASSGQAPSGPIKAWGRRPCPYCGKVIGNDYSRCIHCDRDVQDLTKQEG